MNHVFVDFENVHQVDLTLIGAKSVSFTLLVGPQQSKLDSGLVEKLMEHSASVRLVKLKSKAKNAVDFALAYYLGRAALADPTAYFHIISADKGYDPLIEHLRERHVNVRRHDACGNLTFSWEGKKVVSSEPVKAEPVAKKAAAKKAAVKKVATKKVAAKKVPAKAVGKKVAEKAAVKTVVKADSEEQRFERLLKHLREHPEARPKKKKTLIATIAHLMNQQPDSLEVTSLTDRLQWSGKLTFDENGVPVYQL